MRRALVLIAIALGQSGAFVRDDIRVGVFGLFHPRVLAVSPSGGVLSVRGDGGHCVLRGSEDARLALDGVAVQVACAGVVFRTRVLQVTGPAGDTADLRLSVPGRIARRFHGRLEVTSGRDELVPVVAMDLETAVPSIVAAEQVSSTPREALKAQAVAARSYLVAGRRHRGFDFCDTTHCQFLREPPALDHPAARAARETAGLVLAFRGTPIQALYSASCGGRTRALTEAGLKAADGYPYFSVDCVHRAAADRQGHGIGLCQEGAALIAAEGRASFAEILRYYYPGTTLETRTP